MKLFKCYFVPRFAWCWVHIRQRKNMRKMHTAVRLNQMIRERSDDTQLIVLNLPCVPNNTASQANCILPVLSLVSKFVLISRSGLGKHGVLIKAWEWLNLSFRILVLVHFSLFTIGLSQGLGWDVGGGGGH